MRLPLDFADARINAVLHARERQLPDFNRFKLALFSSASKTAVCSSYLVIQPNLTLGRLIGHDVARRALFRANPITAMGRRIYFNPTSRSTLSSKSVIIFS